MNRLIESFQNAPSDDKLNIYVTAGFPELTDTLPVMTALEAAGVDMIELGIPFSDPLADGPTIQQSSELAIKNGMTIEQLFAQLRSMREVLSIPVILMGYYNSVMQYGLARFIEDAHSVGVDGFIFPDVPPLEFEQSWRDLLNQHDMCFSFLVTPETSEARVRYLDSLSSGFIYAVSSSSTTGSAIDNQQDDITESYLTRLKCYNLTNPIMAGFGIKSAKDYHLINSHVEGAIVGSAFIQHLSKFGTSKTSITDFVSRLKQR